MLWSIDIPQAAYDKLTAKATKDKTTVDAMLTTILTRYLQDVKREAGADVTSNIHKKVEGMTDAEKETLATQIGA